MGRGHELANTLEWVLGVLEHRAYLEGTRYYETAECFLFFSARLLHHLRGEPVHARLEQLLRERVLERAGNQGDALALAMRVLVGAAVGLRMERDLAALLPLQCEDGGWGASWVYKYGQSNIKVGNRGLTTALALNAISALHSPHLRQEQEKSLMGERSSMVNITPAPFPRLTDRSVWPVTEHPLPPSLSLPQVQKRTRKGNISSSEGKCKSQ